MTTLSPKAFQEKLANTDNIIIDLRTLEEQKKYGVISDIQTHIDIYRPNALKAIQALEKEKCYLLYCWHWVRSKQVLDYMKTEGFWKVYDLEGGIDKWNKNNP